MSLSRSLLNLIALPLRRAARTDPDPDKPRILVIRRNRMGDMIYTLPLLHALRRNYPQARLTVACDPPGEAIAGACPAVNEVVILEPGWNPWQAAVKNAAALQGFDWVFAAKGGFDSRLAFLTRLTNGTRRVGFQPRPESVSPYYTDPVALPENPYDEHQIETLLRLLAPTGLSQPNETSIDLSLSIPQSSLEFATSVLSRLPFAPPRRFMLINFSSTVPLKFGDNDFIELAGRVLTSTDLAIGFVAAPVDQPKAARLAAEMKSDRVAAVATPNSLDLAALLEPAVCLLTPEGGAAHLAATMNTPTLVLWSEGPFKKWYSRGEDHAFVHAENGEPVIPLERVWLALQPFLDSSA